MTDREYDAQEREERENLRRTGFANVSWTDDDEPELQDVDEPEESEPESEN